MRKIIAVTALMATSLALSACSKKHEDAAPADTAAAADNAMAAENGADAAMSASDDANMVDANTSGTVPGNEMDLDRGNGDRGNGDRGNGDRGNGDRGNGDRAASDK
jgi:hypothetical protein